MERDYKLVGYGLNVRRNNNDVLERVITYKPNEKEKALNTFNTIKELMIKGEMDIKTEEVELESIYSNEDDYEYETLAHFQLSWWHFVKDGRIDFVDKSELKLDGSICVFLKLGYLSPSTNLGYFYCSGKAEMECQLSKVITLSKANKNQMISYLEWAIVDNNFKVEDLQGLFAR